MNETTIQTLVKNRTQKQSLKQARMLKCQELEKFTRYQPGLASVPFSKNETALFLVDFGACQMTESVGEAHG